MYNRKKYDICNEKIDVGRSFCEMFNKEHFVGKVSASYFPYLIIYVGSFLCAKYVKEDIAVS